MRFKARMPVRIHLNGIGHLPLEITVARKPQLHAVFDNGRVAHADLAGHRRNREKRDILIGLDNIAGHRLLRGGQCFIRILDQSKQAIYVLYHHREMFSFAAFIVLRTL